MPSETLDFVLQEQEADNWCWLATAASVSDYYIGLSVNRQCSLANTLLARLDCCGGSSSQTGPPSQCDVTGKLSVALSLVGNYDHLTREPLDFQTVRGEIDAGRPVCARFEQDGGGGHIQVIYGYVTGQGGNRYYRIADSYYNLTTEEGDLTLADAEYVASAEYWLGQLTHTYFTKGNVNVINRIRNAKWLSAKLIQEILGKRHVLINLSGGVPSLGDPRERAVKGGRVSLGMAHRVYILSLGSLKKAQPPAPRVAFLRVYETEAGRPRAYFDVTEGEEPRLLQMSTAKNYLNLFMKGLAEALAAMNQSAKKGELRSLLVPALKFEALWISYEDHKNDLIVPVRTISSLQLTPFKRVPFDKVIGRLKKAAKAMKDDGTKEGDEPRR